MVNYIYVYIAESIVIIKAATRFNLQLKNNFRFSEKKKYKKDLIRFLTKRIQTNTSVIKSLKLILVLRIYGMRIERR
jgi:hypothetical protein